MMITLEIYPNQGYSAKDVKAMTVGELREMLEDYEDETYIVTYDKTNHRGAMWGYIACVSDVDEDDEEEYDDDDLL